MHKKKKKPKSDNVAALKISDKNKAAIKNTIPMMTGIGGMTSHFNNWNSIESFSKTHGLYTPMDVRQLIFNNSPLKKIGDINLEIVRIIEDDQLKKRNLSFHAACLDNFDALCVLIGQDPNQVHMGVNWEKVQKQKNKNYSRSMFDKKYTSVIETIRSRYQRVVSVNRDVYSQWYKQNKTNRETMNFVNATLKILDRQYKKWLQTKSKTKK